MRILFTGLPGPVAIGWPQFVPSLDTKSSYPRGESPLLPVVSRMTWLNVCSEPRSTWNQSPGRMPRPVLHRVAGSPSIALPGGSVALFADADTVHGPRGNGTAVVGGVSDAPAGRRVAR